MGGLKNEISKLCQQIFVVKGICSDQNKAMMAMIMCKVVEQQKTGY